MKNQFVKAALVLSVACMACTSRPTSYTVSGTVEDTTLNGQTVYFLDKNVRIDSAVVENGAFEFKGVADTAKFIYVTLGRSFVPMFLENGKITLNLDTRKATGSPLNDSYTQYSLVLDSLRDVYVKIGEGEADSVKASSQEKFYNEVYVPAVKESMTTAFNANSNNELGSIMFLNLSNFISEDEFDSLYAQAGEYVKAKEDVKSLVARKEVLKATAEGKPFSDFTVETADGGKVSLSDYVGKGKYVLVDFWASWCGPCRAETPVVAEMYKKYKGDKFEVLGVAVWDKPEDTQKAIEELGITWPQIINAQKIATDAYGINGIPHIILFGPDGTIVARGLRGDKLKEKVAEAMAE